MAESLLVVWNPKAGTAAGAALLRAELEARPDVTLREPRSADEARDLTAAAADRGHDLVVAAGGDGTVNAVVQGLASATKRPGLAVLPLGTGNDFCRTLGMPADPAACAPLLHTDRLRPLDLVQVATGSEQRWYVNVAAGGNSGAMMEALTAEVKQRWGPLCYLRGAVDVVVDLMTFKVTIELDGAPPEEFEALNVVLGNGRYSAGGLLVAPRANPEDGLLDVIVIRDGTPLQLATTAAQFLVTSYLESELVVWPRRARRVRVAAEPPLPFSADGDVLPREPLTFSVHPGAIRVVVGPDYQVRSEYEPADSPVSAAAGLGDSP